MKILVTLARDDQAQDVIEYTLLLAFVAVVSAAIFVTAGGSINTIWSVSNSQLSEGVGRAQS
jgi:Flp pilus assembly pilin Flp